MWIDLSITLSESTICWPGDIPFTLTSQIKDDCITSSFHCSCHAGTHIDAPLHFLSHGSKISEIPISKLIGECHVIAVTGYIILAEHVDKAERNKVIFKTNNRISDCFNQDYVYISPAAATRIVENGIELIGIDYLSVESYNNLSFETHHILLSNNVLIIESLDTSQLTEGIYEIIALPIKINAEASPARVLARRIIA